MTYERNQSDFDELDDGHVEVISSSEGSRRQYLEAGTGKDLQRRLSDSDKAEDTILDNAWSNAADCIELLEESLAWAEKVFRDRLPQTFSSSPVVIKQYKAWLEKQRKEIDQLRERRAKDV